MDSSKVLIVTDGLLSPKESSVIAAVRKMIGVHRNSSGPWLDWRVKLQMIERVLPAKLLMKSRKAQSAEFFPTVNQRMSDTSDLGAPELTEVVLMTLLEEAGMPYEATTYSDLTSKRALREELLASTDCVFASATLLRGLPEVRVVADLLKRPHNHIVLGGALTSILHESWPGVAGIDLLAIGYGEWLVPALVGWIRSGFTTLEPPAGGRVENRGDTPILYSGLPHGRNLDDLTRPDWSLAERYHGRKFPMVHYESVRGCPYRCQFCNYPYLFADDVFRYKSAERIAQDWLEYSENGARIINCLDSLFTVPRKRLLALCDALEGKNIRWICYARADDLARPGVVERMLAAGCQQVQVGIESGNQQMLDNMKKQCTVESNLTALKNCREKGLSTVITVIIGFPGETAETISETLQHLREGKPDFYFAAPFSVLVEKLPVLSEESRQRFGLKTNGRDSSSPYWLHDTMDAAQAMRHVDKFNAAMMKDSVALEVGTMFWAMTNYCRETDRDHLLAYQRMAMDTAPILRNSLRFVGEKVQRRLEQDLHDVLGAS